MLDILYLKNTQIYGEFDEVENCYWFDFKQRKFLHNIDTFYYSVKFAQDFTSDTEDVSVLRFRRHFENLSRELEKSADYGASLSFYVPGLPNALNYRPFSYAGWYNICLECPDYFDIFLAPKVPHSSDGGASVTCECVVQIRSYMLWMYGVRTAYNRC